MPVDLHTHSRYSDGSDAPARLVEAAIGAGLSVVALTDHDILDGNAEAISAAGGSIEVIAGTEISVEWEGRGMHLLAYWADEDSALGSRLEEVRLGRASRNLEMLGALRELGIDITLEEVEEEAGVGVIGRPHFAALLVAKGVVPTLGDAFDQYLARGRPAYRPRPRIDAAEAIALVWDSNSIPVVAHPHTLADDRDEFAELFPAFAELGVAGVECYYAEYPAHVRENAARLAEAAGLVPTGGSDYHGLYKPDVGIGVGHGDLVVPDSAVEALISLRG